MSLPERFISKNLHTEVVLWNEFLNIFLQSRKDIKKALLQHFEKCVPNDRDEGIKKFNLQSWYGGQAIPTLEIVKVGKEIKFAMTHYGVLGPLMKGHLNEPAIKEVIKDFFIHPVKYIKRVNMQTKA